MTRLARPRVEIALAFAGFVVIGLGGGAGGVLLPAQIREYGVDKSIIGLLFFAFSAGYLLAGAANGALLRRLGLRGDLMLGTGVFAASTFAAGLRPAFPVLLALTVLFGLGSGVIDATLNAYVAALPNPTALLNQLHACYGIGALTGPVLASGLLDRGLSWGAVYLVFAAAAMPLIAAYARRYPTSLPDPMSLPDPTSLPADAASARTSSLGAAVRHPAVLLSAVFLTVYVGAEVTLGNWAFSFLVEERGQDSLLAGRVVGGFWLGFTLGRFVLSALAQRFGIGPVALTFGCLGVLGAGTMLTWLVPGGIAAAAGFVLLGAALGPIFPLTIAVLPQLTPGWIVPTAIGLLVGVSVVGGAFFPWLAGTIAEQVGLDSLLPFTAALTVLLLVNWWTIARRMAR